MQAEEPESESSEEELSGEVVDPSDHEALRDAIYARIGNEGQPYRDLLLADIAAGMHEFRTMIDGLEGMIGGGPMGKMVGRMLKGSRQ